MKTTDRNNYQTPEFIIEKVKKVLGNDYFDPCPTVPLFNGLQIDWRLNCFINPPYGRGELNLWSEKAYEEFIKASSVGDQVQYIWLINYGCTNNREQIKKVSTAMCDLYKRVSFIDPETKESANQNDRDSIIYYWGIDIEGFKEAFQDIGEIFVKKVFA